LLTLWLEPDTGTQDMIGKTVYELAMPDGSLIALVRRGDEVIVPHSRLTLQEADRLTIIGDPSQIESLYDRYVVHRDNETSTS
jgi:Trk K+ transport system NAD-binding subunit